MAPRASRGPWKRPGLQGYEAGPTSGLPSDEPPRCGTLSSEVMLMGYLHVDEQRIADNLNRRLSFFPISYLEMLLFDSRIEIWDFDPPPP